jgi:hypothetical protein
MRYFFCVFCFFIISGMVSAQGQPASSKVEQFSGIFPWEKVFLHTDKPHYAFNDTIWIKAYGILESGGENPESTPSVPLYLELVDMSSREKVEQITIKLEQGLGQADIVLPRDLEPGVYSLRAFTQYMRNFGEEAFFHRDIWIGELGEVIFPETPVGPSLNLGFFPEGGHLVAGHPNRVGFKASGSDGLGKDVLGYLLDSKQDTVLRFESSHLGMGSFVFSPAPGERYSVLVKSVDQDWESRGFPAVLEKGISLSVDPLTSEEELYLDIRSKLDESPSRVQLVGLSKGQTVYQEVLELEKETRITLDKDDFFPGITQFTLLDLQGRPIVERLVYFHPFAHGGARFTTEKETYLPKDLVRMEIEVLDEFGMPVEGDFSLSVTDAYQVSHSPHGANIVSHFLLSDELRGEVEQPFYYFDPENENSEEHLDNLLLTQGWRRFSWERLADMEQVPEHPFETGLSISGKVSALGGRPIREPLQLTMVINSPYDMPQVLEGSTDGLGNFKFEGLDFLDSVGVFLQAYTEKENKTGEVTQLKSNEVEVHSKEPIAIAERQVVGVPRAKGFTDHEDYLVEVAEARDLMRQFVLGQEIELGEVTVRGRRSREMADPRTRQYGGNPTQQFVVTPEQYVMQNVFQLLRGRIPGVQVVGDVFKIDPLPIIYVRPAGGVPPQIDRRMDGDLRPIQAGAAFFIDGVPATAGTVANLMVPEIERIDVIAGMANTAVFGEAGGGGVINILTKRGDPGGMTFLAHSTEGLGNATAVAKGYAPYREFYTPPQKQDPGAPVSRDYRSTIFWQPRLVTGEDGRATVEFPLTEGSPAIHVDLQGLSVLGEPVRAVFNFKVKTNEEISFPEKGD